MDQFSQLDLNFDAPVQPLRVPEPVEGVVVIRTYRSNGADQKFRRRIRNERGDCCEHCGRQGEASVHHILETRIFPKYAREPLNVLVLCQDCHAEVGSAENHSPALRCAFYAELSAEVRARHLPFIKSAGVSNHLIAAFERGNADYWHMESIR